jgi:putative PIN family toxin of toxin-antitoxin system
MQYRHQMRFHRAVIDTNVLYSGLYSAGGASYQLLLLIESGRLVPLLSTTLLFEYEEVLKRNQVRLGLSNRDIDDVLDGLCKHGECRKIHFLWRPQLSDAKDDHVLELAVAGGAADIVTYNIGDFAHASPFGVRIIKPAVLLGEIK